MNTTAPTARIRLRLIARDRATGALAVGGILLGLPMLLPGPVLLGSIAWFSLFSLTHVYLTWTTVFWISAAILIPASFITEFRTRGRFLDQAFAEAGPVSEPSGLEMAAATTLGRGGVAMVAALTNPRLSTAGFAELVLTGPRWILSGLRTLRLKRRLRSVDRARAAELLATLLRRPDGAAVQALLQSGETPPQLDPVLAYLAVGGWIGVTKTLDRVYLYTESRETLA